MSETPRTAHAREPKLRPIEPRDDATVAEIIRQTMTEFDCSGPGYAIHDAEVGSMSAHYAAADRAYFVVELDSVVQGGGGFAPLIGASPGARVAEVRKMYFRPALRGLGVGRLLLQQVLDAMRAAGFVEAYLETTTRMIAARGLYTAFGFTELCGAAGDTGHFGCDRFFRLDLTLRDSD